MPYVEYDEVEAICADCGRIFRSEEALTAHREEAHAGLDRREHPHALLSPARATCATCGREFDSATVLRSHAARSHPR
jgi:DNA-directed RNA polymerase subunit RPC12/RpoP